MTCPDPVSFGAATALNIAATDLSEATHNSGGLTVSAAENQFIVISKPRAAESGGALLYDAYSLWSSDDGDPPGNGMTWGNRFYVFGNNGGDETLLFDSQDLFDPSTITSGTTTWFATADDAFESVDSILPLWVGGGYSEYRITGYPDDPVIDNRGGLSLLVALATVADPGLDAPAISGSEDDGVLLAYFAKLEFPDGDVRLCDGGMLEYGGEQYLSEHPIFGSIHTPGAVEIGFGDMAETVTLSLAPKGDADLADWWREDLFDCRVRIWMGKLGAGLYQVSDATLLADMLVDSYSRRQGIAGEDLLELDLMGRAEKLFLKNEGNVLSQRFHQSIYPGEKGMNNCTDLVGYLAWGAATPPRGSTSGGTPSRTIQVSLR